MGIWYRHSLSFVFFYPLRIVVSDVITLACQTPPPISKHRHSILWEAAVVDEIHKPALFDNATYAIFYGGNVLYSRFARHARRKGDE